MESQQYYHLTQNLTLSPGWYVLDELGLLFPNDHKIYINAPNNEISKIINGFTDACLSKDLPYTLKYDNENTRRSDSLVIYSSAETYKKHIDILREMAEKDPALKEACGTPPLLTGVLDGWLGLANESSKFMTSYTEETRDLIISSIYQYIYKNPDLFQYMSSFNAATYEEISSYDNTAKIVLSESDRQILQHKFSDNPAIVQGIFDEFTQMLEAHGRDMSNPIFCAGTREKLQDVEEKSTSSDVELDNLIANSDSATLLAAVTNSDTFANMNVETKVKIMKKLIHDICLEQIINDNIIYDIEELASVGIIDRQSKRKYTSIREATRNSLRYSSYLTYPPNQTSSLDNIDLDNSETAEDNVNARLLQIKEHLEHEMDDSTIIETRKKVEALSMLSKLPWDTQKAKDTINSMFWEYIYHANKNLDNSEKAQQVISEIISKIDESIAGGTAGKKFIKYREEKDKQNR